MKDFLLLLHQDEKHFITILSSLIARTQKFDFEFFVKTLLDANENKLNSHLFDRDNLRNNF